MSSPVLFCSDDSKAILLDLPSSVEDAQDARLQLLSTAALEAPYSSTEPKGNKRAQILQSLPRAVVDYNHELHLGVSGALARVKAHIDGTATAWCRPRWVSDPSNSLTDRHSEPGALEWDETYGFAEQAPVVLSTLRQGNHFESLDALRSIAVLNPGESTSVVTSAPQTAAYSIPPKSCFILATISAGFAAFETAISVVDVVSFDLIVLDPPWANRSVRRGKTYSTTERQASDPFIDALRVLRYLGANGTVAIWITNKPAIREQVISSLHDYELDLAEEWIWTKITMHGQTLTPIDGLWRSPYETLLLFQHTKVKSVKRRFMFAVPDIHSRKPSLKRLSEKLLPLNSDYHALELFARSLTAGWWSWGDDVLKFQHGKNWKSIKEEVDGTS